VVSMVTARDGIRQMHADRAERERMCRGDPAIRLLPRRAIAEATLLTLLHTPARHGDRAAPFSHFLVGRP
jgi:hypothetical protein